MRAPAWKTLDAQADEVDLSIQRGAGMITVYDRRHASPLFRLGRAGYLHGGEADQVERCAVSIVLDKLASSLAYRRRA